MNATYLPGTARRGIGSAILLVGGAAWLSLATSVNAAGFDAAAFADDPAAHATYNRMIEAMHQARSLSYTSRYECEAEGRVLTACTYRVWLKKPNFFRMETRSTTGELEGILIGDGTRLWIHWPKGRPQWKYVVESEADRKTRLTSYMTKPAPRGQHSIAHGALPGGRDGPSDPGCQHVPRTCRLDRTICRRRAKRRCGNDRARGLRQDRGQPDGPSAKLVPLVVEARSSPAQAERGRPREVRLRHAQGMVVGHRRREIPDGTFAWTPPAGWTQWKLSDEEGSLLKPGSKAPDFDLTSVDGGRIKLSDFAGRPCGSASGVSAAHRAARRCRTFNQSTRNTRTRASWSWGSTSWTTGQLPGNSSASRA